MKHFIHSMLASFSLRLVPPSTSPKSEMKFKIKVSGLAGRKGKQSERWKGIAFSQTYKISTSPRAENSFDDSTPFAPTAAAKSSPDDDERESKKKLRIKEIFYT